MKKTILIIIALTILTGCSLGNTPTSRVEDLLSRYQMLDNSIDVSYTALSNDTNLEQDIANKYEETIKKQYRNLSYEIKEEEIDGNTAEVTVQIEVMNYKSIIDKYDRSNYEINQYHKLITDNLEKSKEKITYTLEIPLTLNNEKWQVDDLTEEIKNKLLGIY